MEKAYKNAGYFALLLIPLVILGFYKTYFSQFPDFSVKITLFHHLHAAIASVWVLILITQPFLARNGRYKIHKSIGKISYFIFPLLILSFVPLIMRILASDHPIISFFPIADCILLILFYSLAVYNRRNTPKHMRYMIGTAIVFLSPIIARIGPNLIGLSHNVTQISLYGFIYFVLISLIFLDRKHDNNFRPYLIIIIAWGIQQTVFNLLF